MQLFQTMFQLQEKHKHVDRVLKEGNLEIVNIQLQAGESIPEHDAPTHVLIVVRRGSVRFTVEGRPQELTNQEILLMEPKEKHSLEALEDVDLLVIKMNV